MSAIQECPHCGDRWAGDKESHCCHGTRNEDTGFQLTPKGRVIATALAEGLETAAGTRIWEALESHCMRLVDRDSEYAALIFDGEGGTVVGATKEVQ